MISKTKKPGNVAGKSPRVVRSADGRPNVHGGGTADSSPTVQHSNRTRKNASDTPENTEIGYQNSEIGGNSARNEAVRSQARDEFGRLRLRQGQACVGSKLDDALEEKICGFIAAGLSLLDSCRLVDLDAATVHRWKHKGAERKGSRYELFLERVLKAESACKAILVKKVALADDWRAAAFLLKVKWPLEFTEHVRTEISGPEGAPLSMGAPAFNVVFDLGNSPADLNWQVVDHRLDKEKDGQSSLADMIAANTAHKQSVVEQDPFDHTPVPVPSPVIDARDALSAKSAGSAFIRPPTEGTKIRR